MRLADMHGRMATCKSYFPCHNTQGQIEDDFKSRNDQTMFVYFEFCRTMLGITCFSNRFLSSWGSTVIVTGRIMLLKNSNQSGQSFVNKSCFVMSTLCGVCGAPIPLHRWRSIYPTWVRLTEKRHIVFRNYIFKVTSPRKRPRWNKPCNWDFQ